MKKVFVLGSTGSIGINALSVLQNLHKKYKVVGITGHSNSNLLAQQIKMINPKYVVITDKKAQLKIKESFRTKKVMSGAEGLEKALALSSPDIVVNAIWGTAGVNASIIAVKHCRVLALANKESMVVAGQLLSASARKYDCSIIPIDSEHSAVFQALLAGNRKEVRRIILTASGGPLRCLTKKALNSVKPEQALNHPVWSMGKRITIDSATMMNKALEMIEARYLFGLQPEQIEVIVHPESIVHSIVEFCDSSMIAQMSVPDMRVAIQFALTYPERHQNQVKPLDLTQIKKLTFLPIDEEKFPALTLGKKVLKMGGSAGAVVTTANEVAAEAFLAGKIRFPQIVEIVDKVLDSHRLIKHPDIKYLNWVQRWAHEKAYGFVLTSIHSKQRRKR
ncbi:MAG: 1-deoxy-D-xylulose-5-phosphate reductoisomerase [Planctomycetota bacterium]